LTLPHEKRFVASLLGMSPENLSRAFASLADYGVEVAGPRVTISRQVVLERLAKPDPLIDKHLPSDSTLISKADRERSCHLRLRSATAAR
jgi:CRP/FNR family transcriptional activator FtrB